MTLNPRDPAFLSALHTATRTKKPLSGVARRFGVKTEDVLAALAELPSYRAVVLEEHLVPRGYYTLTADVPNTVYDKRTRYGLESVEVLLAGSKVVIRRSDAFSWIWYVPADGARHNIAAGALGYAICLNVKPAKIETLRDVCIADNRDDADFKDLVMDMIREGVVDLQSVRAALARLNAQSEAQIDEMRAAHGWTP